MEVKERRIEKLELDNGDVPFDIWFESLKDKKLQIAVDARLTRVANGNFGDHKSVGDGVFELRIDKGPGLRVYYGLHGEVVVILLCGGDKGSQSKDIRNAKELWEAYKNENKRL